MESREKTYFAGGCFWGVEFCFQNIEGVLSTRVGYMGGQLKNPGYKEVSTGRTGHAETVEVVFNSSEVSFKELAELFFEIHDPTQKNRQGPDVGSQYRSVIFYTNSKQKQVSKKLIRRLREKGYEVVTQLKKAGTFWEAEKHHQKYYEKKGLKPACSVRTERF